MIGLHAKSHHHKPFTHQEIVEYGNLAMKPFTSMWLYPWDLVDEGADSVLENIKERAGLNSVNMATCYHTARCLLPHNPKRKLYFAEEGRVYFAPRLEHYRDTKIRPIRSTKLGEIDELKLLVDKCDEHGLNPVAWTICFHNTALAEAYPHAAIQTAFGDTDINWLCPNSPDARGYVLGLLEDIASNYDVYGIELESPGFQWGFGHGYHHEKIPTPIDLELSLLLSSCFCENCQKEAAAQGIDLAFVKEIFRSHLERRLAVPAHIYEDANGTESYASKIITLLTQYPEIYQFLRFRQNSVTDFMTEARRRVKQASSRIRLFAINMSPELAWMDGQNTRRIADIVDAVELLAYYRRPAQVQLKVMMARELIGDKTKLHTGFEISRASPDEIPRLVRAAKQAGSDGFIFYNYGLGYFENFDAIKQAVGSI